MSQKRVLILHNRYQRRGGEDEVVELEAQLLSDAGHDVTVDIISNDDIDVRQKALILLGGGFDTSQGERIQRILRSSPADVVHIHNFFPKLTLAAHVSAADSGAAVVQTLHNFRLVCAGAMLGRQGHVCEKCLHGSTYWGVVHKCYRGSALASLGVVAMQNRARSGDMLNRHVDRFITLTNFAKQKFIEGGLPARLLVVKPNFVPDRLASPLEGRIGAVFVGRLSPEKGVGVLLEAFRSLPHLRLKIIGSGPEEDILRANAPSNVLFTGQLSRDEVSRALSESQIMIVPSLWYEGFPMTIVEAFAAQLPVVASDIGSLGEIVEPGQNGQLFPVGDHVALAGIVKALMQDPETVKRLGATARRQYETRYSGAQNLRALESIYEEAMEERRLRNGDVASR
jgi:glycosyltransferase involved in cell wall biosynthesis